MKGVEMMEQMLQQILQEIQSVKTDVLSLHQDNQSLKESVKELHQNQTDLQKNQLRMEESQSRLAQNQIQLTESQSRLEANQIQANAHILDIHNAVVRLENDQPKDIVALLETFNNYFDEKDSELATLNHRVFRVESRLERMSMRA